MTGPTLKAFIVLSLTSVLFCCEKKKDEPTPQLSEVTPAKKNVSQGEVVTLTLEVQGLQDTYDASFGDQAIPAGKLSDSTLVFVVPIDAVAGENKFVVEKLKITSTYNVSEVTLSAGIDAVVIEASTKIEEAISTFSDAGEGNVAEAQEVFEKLLADATDQEKKEFAVYYEANKEAFEAVLSISTDSAGRKKSGSNLPKFLNAVEKIALGSGLIYASPNFGQFSPLIFSAGVLTLATGVKRAKEFHHAFREERLKILDIDWFDGGRKKSDQLFFGDEPQRITLKLNMRGLTQVDRIDGLAILKSYFAAYDFMNSFIGKINTAIEFSNDNIPFSNISLIQTISLPDEDEPKPIPMTAELFSRVSLVVQHEHIRISEKKFENGALTLTLSSDVVLDFRTVISTTLRMTIVNEYNNFESEVPFDYIPVTLDMRTIGNDGIIKPNQPENFTVIVTTKQGDPVQDAEIEFEITGGNGTVNPTRASTDSDGKAVVKVESLSEEDLVLTITLLDHEGTGILHKNATLIYQNPWLKKLYGTWHSEVFWIVNTEGYERELAAYDTYLKQGLDPARYHYRFMGNNTIRTSPHFEMFAVMDTLSMTFIFEGFPIFTDHGHKFTGSGTWTVSPEGDMNSSYVTASGTFNFDVLTGTAEQIDPARIRIETQPNGCSMCTGGYTILYKE